MILNISNYRIVVLFVLLVTQLIGSAQDFNPFPDTLYFMNANTMGCKVIDSTLYGAKVQVPAKKGKTKEMVIEGIRLFSIKFADGHEKIIYKQDSAVENYFTIEETRLFIKGEQDAQRGFKSTWTNVGAGAIGIAGGTFNPILAFLPPFAYAGAMLIPKIKIKQHTVSNKQYLKYDTYLLGYERVARKRKAMNAFVYGISGAVTGILIKAIILDK
ncbi:MAG: hypothetical protein J0M08_03320 [Bacteroidetes bacterium]|nr:hypothetical protein [Bacteroidota bacterium]